jgi:hypothetical protein
MSKISKAVARIRKIAGTGRVITAAIFEEVPKKRPAKKLISVAEPAPPPIVEAPLDTSPGAVEEDPKRDQKLAKIALLLGVDPMDEDALRKAFEALFAPVEASRRVARRKLSAREREIVRTKHICPAKYLSNRNALRRSKGS